MPSISGAAPDLAALHPAPGLGPDTASSPGSILPFPAEFLLFGLVLLGIALFHRRALTTALAGLAAVVGYEVVTGRGERLQHALGEWSTLSNLFLLLVGFQVVARHFEQSAAPDHLPSLLPDNWTGGLALLTLVFVMSAVLDNIAAALIGGVMARHAYRGRVGVAFVVALTASANAGGAGSVVGDTTTTMMWIYGAAPTSLLPAYVGAAAAFLASAVPGALIQQRHHPILKHNAPGHPIRKRHLAAVAAILGGVVAVNAASNPAGLGERWPLLGLAVWVGIAATAVFARPDLGAALTAAKGALFLVALVACASLMPLSALPDPSWPSTLGLGAVSSVFDNIPLTALALRQGGYDWPLLAFAVGFGGSMLWFGSSAGVALSGSYPKARSVFTWLREGWFAPLAYLAGFALMLAVEGWRPAGP